MKIYKVFVIISFLNIFSSCYIAKAVKYRKYHLSDIPKFDVEHFQKSKTPFRFYQGSLPMEDKLQLDSSFQGSNIYSFLIIRNDSILYEFYNQGISDSTILPSFSVAKSFTSTLVQMAHQEGRIKSLDEPITNYIPELKNRDSRFEKITIQHVLDMRSGIKSTENYGNPLSDVLKLGFAKNIRAKMLKIKIESEPNLTFEYKSANTQLLAMIVESATKERFKDYFYRKIYQPLDMEYDASWHIDDVKHREIRAFCCLNMAARDFAKFGKLYLDKGKFHQTQLLDSNWVSILSHSDTMEKYDGYKNQWWKGSGNGNFQAVGILGQSIAIFPSKHMIIVKLQNTQLPSHPLKKGWHSTVNKIVGL